MNDERLQSTQTGTRRAHAQYAIVGGARLYYQDRGHGPPLLLVHGLGASHADWNAQIDYFARIFRVIAPDLRGHGDSDHRPPYGVLPFADDLLQLADQLNLGSFLLAGHSMGGAVALQMALLKPERIAKLVLCNTLPDFRPLTVRKKLMRLYRIVTVRLLGMEWFARSSAQRLFPRPDQAALRTAAAARNGRNPRAAYLACLNALTTWSVADKLDWLRMPVLLLGSQHDYFAAEETLAFVEKLPDGRSRIFDRAHHGLPMEMPDEVCRAMMEFLMPGSASAAAKGEAGLNWLRTDPKSVPLVDVQALLGKPGGKGR